MLIGEKEEAYPCHISQIWNRRDKQMDLFKCFPSKLFHSCKTYEGEKWTPVLPNSFQCRTEKWPQGDESISSILLRIHQAQERSPESSCEICNVQKLHFKKTFCIKINISFNSLCITSHPDRQIIYSFLESPEIFILKEPEYPSKWSS